MGKTTYGYVKPALLFYEKFLIGHILDIVGDYGSEFKLCIAKLKDHEVIPSDSTTTLQNCSENFPSTKIFLQIIITLPVVAVSGKR